MAPARCGGFGRPLVAAARKDLVRRLRDPLALLLWMLIPLVTGGLMTVLFGGDESPRPHGVVYVIDEDESFLSGFVTRAFEFGPLGEMLEVQRPPLEEARARLGRGDGSALVRIPAGFGAALLEDRDTTIELRLNPSQSIVPEIVRSTLDLIVDATFYLQRAFGEELRTVIERVGTKDEQRLRNAISLHIGRLFESIDDYVLPPLFELRTEAKPLQAATGAPRPPFALLLVPGLIVFALLFVAQGLSEDLWQERGLCTLARAAATPHGILGLLIGKILGFALLIGPITALLVAIAMAWHGVPLARFPAIVVFGWAAGIGLLALMLVLQTFASSQRGAAIFTSIVVFPLAMLGGSIFPLSSLPGFLAAIGRWTPNGWATQELTRMFVFGVDAASWWTGLAALLAGSFLLVALALWRVRRGWLGGA